MSRRRILRRYKKLKSIVTLALTLFVFTPTYIIPTIINAQAITEGSIFTKWIPSSAAVSQTMTYDNARSWILSKMTKCYNDFNNEIQKGSSADKTILITRYAEYLAYVCWIMDNGYGYSDTDDKTSIFNPTAELTDVVGIKEALTTLNNMNAVMKQNNNDILSSTNNIANGQISQIEAIVDLPTIPDNLNITEFIKDNWFTYISAYNAIITRYLDAGILVTLATHEDAIGLNIADYDELVVEMTKFYDFTDRAENGTSDDTDAEDNESDEIDASKYIIPDGKEFGVIKDVGVILPDGTIYKIPTREENVVDVGDIGSLGYNGIFYRAGDNGTVITKHINELTDYYVTIKEDTDNEDDSNTSNPSSGEMTQETVYNKFKDKLDSYFEMYTMISAAFKEPHGYALSSFKNSSMQQTLIGYTRELDVDEITSLSTPAQALWEYYQGQKSTGIGSVEEDTSLDVDLSEYDMSDGILPLISNAMILNDKVVVQSGEEPDLNNLGYIMLAAGVTYDPFVSTACNDGIQEVIKNFIKSESDIEKMLEVMQRASNYKKPLFYTEVRNTDWVENGELDAVPVGDYKAATISDILNKSTETLNVFSVIMGSMSPSDVDGSTWEYSNGLKDVSSETTVKANSSSTTTDAEVDEEDEDGDTEEENQEEEKSKAEKKNITIAGKEFTGSENQLSYPIAITAGKGKWNVENWASKDIAERIGSLTTLILNNAAQDTKSNSKLKAASAEYLFLNGLGDIVTEDNTVILPAIANPVLYTYDDSLDTDYSVSEESNELLSEIKEFSYGYYPYNAAFMNHYPSIGLSKSNSFWKPPTTDNAATIANGEAEKDKLMISYSNDNIIAYTINKIKNNSFKLSEMTYSYLPPIALNSFSVTNEVNEKSRLLNLADTAYGWGFFTGYDTMLYKTGGTTGDSMSFFPLIDTSKDVLDDFAQVGSYLATSAIRYISTSEDGKKISSGAFNVEKFITDFAGQGLIGTQYTSTIVKNYKTSYDDIVDDTGSRLLKFVKTIAEFTVENIGRIDGVLSIKNAYDNPFFNLIMRFLQKYYLFIAVALMLVLAVRFLVGRYSIFYVILIFGLIIAGFETYTNWLPTLMPSLYNFAVNDIVEDITWNTVANQAESYEETYADSDRTDTATGELKPYTSTITLYKLTDADIEDVAGRFGVSEESIRRGETIDIDSTAGIFIKGNEIRMSIDKLLANNTLRGLYQSQWDSLDSNSARDKNFITPIDVPDNQNPYSIQLTVPYTSLESYYTMFPYIERSFLENLNNFSAIFMLERRSFAYKEDLYKDAFIVLNFLNSGIFTAPGRDDVLELNIMDIEDNGVESMTKDEIITLCNSTFYPQEDWLNLRSIFGSMTEPMKESLWGQMLQRNDYFDDEWNVNEEKVTDLIIYMNNQTKKFIYDNFELFNYCSDENAIKLISLYATTTFCHRVSTVSYWLYPVYINTGDIELQDVMYGCMTTLRDKNNAESEDNVVDILAVRQGMFGVLFIIVITILSVAFIFIMNYLIPILYLLFGGILIFKLINVESSTGVTKGYFKVTFVTVLLYFLYGVGLNLIKVSNYNWFGYLGCLLITLLCIYLLGVVIISVFQDIGELGNNSLNANIKNAIDKLTRGSINKLLAKTLHVRNSAVARAQHIREIVRYNRSTTIDNQGWSDTRRGQRNNYDYYGRMNDISDSNRGFFNRFRRR